VAVLRDVAAGKALRATAVNRLGARLMGISSSSAGRLSFTMAAFIGALSGLLIGRPPRSSTTAASSSA
jgi:branched-subunit amino acid ABC-type transport system permease component